MIVTRYELVLRCDLEGCRNTFAMRLSGPPIAEDHEQIRIEAEEAGWWLPVGADYCPRCIRRDRNHIGTEKPLSDCIPF